MATAAAAAAAVVGAAVVVGVNICMHQFNAKHTATHTHTHSHTKHTHTHTHTHLAQGAVDLRQSLRVGACQHTQPNVDLKAAAFRNSNKECSVGAGGAGGVGSRSSVGSSDAQPTQLSTTASHQLLRKETAAQGKHAPSADRGCHSDC